MSSEFPNPDRGGILVRPEPSVFWRRARRSPLAIAASAAIIVALAVAFISVILPGGFASASSPTTWTGNGSENLPCTSGGRWILSPAEDITSATLTVDGHTYTMAQNGQGSFWADSNGPVTGSSTAFATYQGNNDKAFLKLTGCVSGPNPPHLTLTKGVTNDNGGAADASEWTLTATGTGGFSDKGLPKKGDTASVEQDVLAGVQYTLSESNGPSGYTAGAAWSCTGGTFVTPDKITLAAGDNVTCTITNNDNPPAHLKLTKDVTNDNGGAADASEWTLTATGTGGFSDKGLPKKGDTASVEQDVLAGVQYTLSESNGPSGYTAGAAWSCTGGTFVTPDKITLAADTSVTCTITNDDIAPSLTLDKIVVNDNGGTALESAWTLTADGTAGTLTGPGAAGDTDVVSGDTFKAGTYALFERGGPATDYNASSWSCVKNGGDPVTGASITLALADTATCTIKNTYSPPSPNPPSLTVTKTVVGGTATPSDFTIHVTGNSPSPASFSGANNPPTTVTLGEGSYNVTEDASGPANYAATYSGDCSGNIANGQSKNCTVINTYTPPIIPPIIPPFIEPPAAPVGALTVIKHVINNNGGTKTAADFKVHVKTAGADVTGSPQAGSETGTAYGTLAAGTYTVSEDPAPAGYAQASIICDGAATSTFTITGGDVHTCTITNDDQAATLVVIKRVVGTAASSDFTISVTGPNASPASFKGADTPGTSVGLNAGAYSVTESGPSGYTATYSADCSGTIANGQTRTCTITNTQQPAVIPPVIIAPLPPVTGNSGYVATESSPAWWMLLALFGSVAFVGTGTAALVWRLRRA